MQDKEITQESDTEKEPRKKTRVVVMLGARMRETKGDIWSFPLVNELPAGKTSDLPVEVSGGDSRMRAIQTIYQEYSEEHKPDEKLLILTTGGREKTGDSRADEAAKKLAKKYDVPEGMTESLGSALGSAPGTLGNAGAVFEYIKAHKEELGETEEIEVVTNDFHMLRAWLMFASAEYKLRTGKDLEVQKKDIDQIGDILDKSLNDIDCSEARGAVMAIIRPYLEGSEFTIKLAVAEDLIAGNPNFKGGKEYARKIKENEWVRKTRELENRGVMAFLEKRYNKQ